MASSKTVKSKQAESLSDQSPHAPGNESTASTVVTSPEERTRTRFVSYSANFEDVILNRIFAGRRTGFFIDVGAGHPLYENDTKLLYDAGWTGINVEPNPAFFNLLETGRTRDTNMNLALSDRVGTIQYYEVRGTGLSTCDERFAEQARAKGYEVIARIVEVSTLADVLAPIQPTSVELLKIDVEGFEERVLAGNDWARYRPSVIVVEATYPETPKRRPSGIREYLEERNYHWRYFDGLNDFYVADEFVVADEVFQRPPNVFDGFRLCEMVELEKRIEQLGNANEQIRNANEQLGNANEQLRNTNEQLGNEHEKLKLDIADEKFERYRLEQASDRLRQDIIAYSRDLKDAHLEAEELVYIKGVHAALKEKLVQVEQIDANLRRQLAESELVNADLRRKIVQTTADLEGRIVQTAADLREKVAQNNGLSSDLHVHVAMIHELRGRLQETEAAYRSVLSSSSWAVTGPLRALGRLLKRLARIVRS